MHEVVIYLLPHVSSCCVSGRFSASCDMISAVTANRRAVVFVISGMICLRRNNPNSRVPPASSRRVSVELASMLLELLGVLVGVWLLVVHTARTPAGWPRRMIAASCEETTGPVCRGVVTSRGPEGQSSKAARCGLLRRHSCRTPRQIDDNYDVIRSISFQPSND